MCNSCPARTVSASAENTGCGCSAIDRIFGALNNLFAPLVSSEGGCGCNTAAATVGNTAVMTVGNTGCGCGSGGDLYYARQYALYPFGNTGCGCNSGTSVS